MDSFLKKFNRSPKEAIQFLIEKQLCDDTEEDIAFMLLTTEGLNKEQLGLYFGSSKEINQAVLESFCSLMDFRGLRFDEAIRLFLSRFRLPGEAQQIDRIVQKFTTVFSKDNPEVFKDEDTPYILCYAAIMLNVDAHSEKIEKKNKMQKTSFVNINLSCTKNSVSREFLEELYDNIVKSKFETKIDYIEKIYSRLPVESMSQQFNGQNRMKIIKSLQAGSNCLKYGRKGKPHERRIWLSELCDKIMWGPPVINQQQFPKKGSVQTQKSNSFQNDSKNKQVSTSSSRFLLIKDIVDFTLGSNTTEVMMKNVVPVEFDQYCFSLITRARTLDLKCNDADIKGKWIAFIYNILNDRRIARKNERMEHKQVTQQEKLSEVWKVDIFAKWDSHWDYSHSKPKNLYKYEQEANEAGFMQKLCKCFKPKDNKPKPMRQSSSLSNQSKIPQQQLNPSFPQSNSKYYEELEMPNHANKSLLLISLWKIGMPKWVRKTIWPLTIGNRLEITDNLYNILSKQLEFFNIDSKQYFSLQSPSTLINGVNVQNQEIPLHKQELNDPQKENLFKNQKEEKVPNDKFENKQRMVPPPAPSLQVQESLEKMLKDLTQMRSKSIHQNLNPKQQKTLYNILSAFILYRPDIGYIQESMANLAAVLVHNIDEEQQAFKCFINLLHSYHFLTFFRGDMSEIKWRVQFFNQNLLKRMPFVLQHFKALDLSSELFLMQWFLNLFTNVFDEETVFRIWDNFLLEGELFAYKAGIAFIEYFHLEFKMATFDDAIHLLRNPPQDIFCSDLYFDIIEDIKIPYKEFNDLLDQQNIAKLAPYILQQLL